MGLEELAPYLQETLANNLVYSDDEMVDMLQEAMNDLRKAKLDPAPPATKDEFPKITPGSVFERGTSLTASKRAKMPPRDRKNTVEVPIGRPESPPPEKGQLSPKHTNHANVKHVKPLTFESHTSEEGDKQNSLSPDNVHAAGSKRLSEYENLLQADANRLSHSPDLVRQQNESHPRNRLPVQNEPHSHYEPRSHNEPRSPNEPRLHNEPHSNNHNYSQNKPRSTSDSRPHKEYYSNNGTRSGDHLPKDGNVSRHHASVGHMSHEKKSKSSKTTFYVDANTDLSPVEAEIPPQELRRIRKDPKLELAYRRAQNNSVWVRNTQPTNGEVDHGNPHHNSHEQHSNQVRSPHYPEDHHYIGNPPSERDVRRGTPPFEPHDAGNHSEYHHRGNPPPERHNRGNPHSEHHQRRTPPPYQTKQVTSPTLVNDQRFPDNPGTPADNEVRRGSGSRMQSDHHDAFYDPRRRQPPPYPIEKSGISNSDALVSIHALKQHGRQRTLPKGVLITGQMEYDITEL